MTQELRAAAQARLNAEGVHPKYVADLAYRKEAHPAAILALLDRLEKAEKALEVAANALSLALSDIDWRKDSPTQPVIHKAYQKAMKASK